MNRNEELEVMKEKMNSKEMKRMEEHYHNVIRKKDKAINQLQAYKELIVEELKLIKSIIQNLNFNK
jgi:hypothetical protein